MLLRPHVLVRLPRLLKRKHLLINHGLDTIRIDGFVHFDKLQAAAYIYASYNTHMAQAFQKGGLVFTLASEEANNRDYTFWFDGVEGLLHCCGATHFYHMVQACMIGGQGLRSLAPGRVGLVVDYMIRAELLQGFGFGIGRSGSDDAGAGSFGKLNNLVNG